MAERQLPEDVVTIKTVDYPSNSKTPQPTNNEPRRELGKIARGTTVRRKKGFGRKAKDALLGEDSRSVGDYILHDVLIPSLKNLINDAVGGGIETLLFGSRRTPNTYRNGGRVYYDYSNNRGRDNTRERGTRDAGRREERVTTRQDFDDIEITYKEDAEKILAELIDLTMDYDEATLAEYYEMAGVSQTHTDRNWGWTDLRSAYITRYRRGWTIVLPKPVLLKPR